MPKIQYQTDPLQKPSLAIIAQADQIATDYRNRGYGLTLRQLYYQFVARDLLPNTEASYNKLGRLVNLGRLNGLIDWNHIDDRGREAHNVDWAGTEPKSTEDLIREAKYGYLLDMWEGQERRVEVWVEKQALEEVAQKATQPFRLGYFACKGYVSQSEMWAHGRRMRETNMYYGQAPLVLHLGDHDPSGIDMTRDIQERLSLFAGFDVEVRRLALNMDQIEDLNPPPNPAKVTDSRFRDYQEIYGDESWELDAVSPEQLEQIIEDEVRTVLDDEMFRSQIHKERLGWGYFDNIADNWDEIKEHIDENFPVEVDDDFDQLG